MRRISSAALVFALGALAACGRANEQKAEGNTAIAGSGSSRNQTASAGASSWLVGRWGEGGSCDDAIEFMGDGRAVVEGDEGRWSLDGQALTLTAGGQTETVTATQVEGNQLSLDLGSRTETFTRC